MAAAHRTGGALSQKEEHGLTRDVKVASLNSSHWKTHLENNKWSAGKPLRKAWQHPQACHWRAGLKGMGIITCSEIHCGLAPVQCPKHSRAAVFLPAA